MKHNNPPAFVKIVAIIGDLCNEAKTDDQVRTGPEGRYPNSLFITITILRNLFGSNSESGFLRYLGNHHSRMFSELPEQSWCRRKTKKLAQEIDTIHQVLLRKLGVHRISIRIVDATGVPVVKLHRSRHCRSFRKKSEVGYGYCASKKSYYYGEKLTLVITPEGIPTAYVLTPANVHDVKALKQNLATVGHALKNKTTIADLGYYDGELEMELREEYCGRLVTPEKRRHQKRNSPQEKKLLRLRGGIERINEQLQDHMRLQETRALSQTGLETRVQSIITSFTLGMYVNMLWGRNLLELKSLVS